MFVLRPPMPLITSDHRMRNNAASAIIVASPQAATKMPLTIRRCIVRPIMPRSLIGDAGEQRPGCREYREGYEEENKAERDQRGGVHVAGRFGEFIGNGRGNGRARVEQ